MIADSMLAGRGRFGLLLARSMGCCYHHYLGVLMPCITLLSRCYQGAIRYQGAITIMDTNPFTTNRFTGTTTRLAPPPLPPWRAQRWSDRFADWLSYRDPWSALSLIVVAALVAFVVYRYPALDRERAAAQQPIIAEATPALGASAEAEAASVPTAEPIPQVVAF